MTLLLFFVVFVLIDVIVVAAVFVVVAAVLCHFTSDCFSDFVEFFPALLADIILCCVSF